jgi:signal transduction histidine kinase
MPPPIPPISPPITPPIPSRPAPPPFLRVGGVMAAATAAFDWAATPLGPPDGWPVALRTLVSLMLESVQPMFIAWGEQRTWLYNDAFVPILGDKHPGALGRPALDEVWVEARSDLVPLFARVFRGDPVHMDDIGLRLRRHGELREAHFAFSYNPVRDDTGAVAGLFGTCIETTDRVQTERTRAADQRRQRDLFMKAPGFIAVLHGAEHVFEFVNEAYQRLVGGRPLLGLSVRDAFPELAGQGFFELLDRVYRTGERYVASRLVVRLDMGEADLDRRYLDFIYEPIVDDAGGVSGVFVEGYDTTEVHRAQAILQASARRQERLVELDDLLHTLDDPSDISFETAQLLGRALGVSRAGYGTVDLAAETITIERDWNAPGIRSIAGVLRFRDYGTYIEDLKRGETVVFHDATLDPRTRETAERLRAISAVSAINMPVTEHEGLVALLFLNHEAPRTWTDEDLAFIREVALRTRMAVERRRAERELRALADSLEQQVAARTAALHQIEEALRQSQKLEAMGQLTGGVAHDFNNLLAVISNNVTLHGRLSPMCEHSAQLAAIARAANTGAQLTRQLLAFARRQAVRPEAIYLADELPPLRAMLQTTLGNAIAVGIRVMEGLPPVWADRSELELAVINLAMNARDAMPDGGRLDILCEADSGSVAIEVRDTGTGIPPDVLERVFEPFFTTKEPGRGTGLGLSQVYGFATQAGGRVAVDSTPGTGTAVRMVLPAAPQRERPAGTVEGRAADTRPLVGRVLLVEDNADVCETTRELLQIAGCHVVVATSGLEARALLSAQPPLQVDLVLTDIVMPGALNGLELAVWIQRERPGTPVVLATGYSAQLGAASSHAFTVLQKPVAPATLIEAVRRGLQQGARH